MSKEHLRKLLLDMAILVSISLLVGVIWNRSILVNVWNGKPIQAETAKSPDTPAAQAEKPPVLPLGLMQVKDFYDRHEAVFVDARDRETYKKGHIDGAVSLPLGEADKEMESFRQKVPLQSIVTVYCNGFDCHDSKNLADKLIGAGYASVFIFEGGFPEWQDAGYPVGKGLAK